MSTTRKLYTLGEVKQLIAKKENCPVENVSVFENNTIQIEILLDEFIKLDDNCFLFQADIA
jgi:hypothetical protein